MTCSQYANNDGGLWCWRHPVEIPAGACAICPQKGEAHDRSADHHHLRLPADRVVYRGQSMGHYMAGD